MKGVRHSLALQLYSLRDMARESFVEVLELTQLDLGWVLHGGADPVHYLRKMAGRCPLVHIKDFDQNKQQTDVGCGMLDLEKVVVAAAHVKVEWLILETEEYKVSPEESIRAGLMNVKKALEA